MPPDAVHSIEIESLTNDAAQRQLAIAAEGGATSPQNHRTQCTAHQGCFGSRPPKWFSSAAQAVRVARICVRSHAEPRHANLDVHCRSPCDSVATGDRQLGHVPRTLELEGRAACQTQTMAVSAALDRNPS